MFELGRYDEAIPDLEKGKDGYNCDRACFQLRFAYEKLGKIEEAIRTYEDLLRRDKRHTVYLSDEEKNELHQKIEHLRQS